MQIAPQGTLGSVGYLDCDAGTNMAAVGCGVAGSYLRYELVHAG